jgi:hypothetical protein
VAPSQTTASPAASPVREGAARRTASTSAAATASAMAGIPIVTSIDASGRTAHAWCHEGAGSSTIGA